MMAGVIRWERVSEAVQTSKRENESQTLDWDITFDPPADPSKFLMGQGLHYPVIYDSEGMFDHIYWPHCACQT
jgi:hypothetical protein